MKRQGMLVGKFEFNSYGRLEWTLTELHYTLKRYHSKRNRFDYYLCLREDPVGIRNQAEKTEIN